METSETIKDLASALSKAQAIIEGAKKDSTNPHFKSKYADLAAVWDACRDALTKNGLSVVQAPGPCAASQMEMTTMLMHSSGEWIRETLTIPLQKVDAQGYGSATTYARRYALAAMVGVAPDDDDGNAAVSSDGAANNAPRIPAQREKLDGMFQTKTALRRAADSFYRDLLGCGDQDMLSALLTSPDTQALKDQLLRDWPGYMNGEGMPGDFECINSLVKRLKKELPESNQMEAAE